MTTAQQELEKTRHSLAHVLAYAVKRLFPEVKIGIGPVTDTGFYYEFDSPHKFTHTDLADIEEEMNKIINENLPFVNIIIPKAQAQQTLLQLGETYKSELLENIPDNEVSFYKTGDDFIDMCRGPHVKSTGDLGNFKLINIREGHWLNDHTRPMMQKIEGIAFESKTKLDQYLANINRMQEVNSIEIGKKLKYFTINEKFSSSPIYLGRGIQLFEGIKSYVRSQMLLTGLHLVQEPIISDLSPSVLEEFMKYIPKKKYKIEEKYQLRWLNTAFLVEQAKKDNDQGQFIATINTTYDAGLQAKEIKQLTDFSENTSANSLAVASLESVPELLESQLKLIANLLKAFGFSQFKSVLEVPNYQKLDKYLYDEKLWDESIKILKELISDLKLPSKIKEDGAAFYGPRLGIVVKDKFLREWRIANIVLDPMLPSKWKLASSGSKFFIHSNVLESVEKLVDLLLEHGEGKLPLWIAPTQVQIISMASNFNHKAIKIERDLREQGFRANCDLGDSSPEDKISNALQNVYPYIIIVGEKEVTNDAFSVKSDSGEDIGLMRVSEIISKLKAQVQEEVAQ